jgi:hypothetical protein
LQFTHHSSITYIADMGEGTSSGMPVRCSVATTLLLLLLAQLVVAVSAKGKSAQTIEKTFEPGQGGVTERTGASRQCSHITRCTELTAAMLDARLAA